MESRKRTPWWVVAMVLVGVALLAGGAGLLLFLDAEIVFRTALPLEEWEFCIDDNQPARWIDAGPILVLWDRAASHRSMGEASEKDVNGGEQAWNPLVGVRDGTGRGGARGRSLVRRRRGLLRDATFAPRVGPHPMGYARPKLVRNLRRFNGHTRG